MRIHKIFKKLNGDYYVKFEGIQDEIPAKLAQYDFDNKGNEWYVSWEDNGKLRNYCGFSMKKKRNIDEEIKRCGFYSFTDREKNYDKNKKDNYFIKLSKKYENFMKDDEKDEILAMMKRIEILENEWEERKEIEKSVNKISQSENLEDVVKNLQKILEMRKKSQ